MNTSTYTSGNLFSYSSYANESAFGLFETVFMEELAASLDKVKEYLLFKKQLDEEEKLHTLKKSYMSLTEVRETIRKRETRITHFIETLSDNQTTLLYLLFQTGSGIQAGTQANYGDICKLSYLYVDSEFNFSHTNNRQFKLSYFHDYLFTRNDAAKNVELALKELI